MVVLNDRTCDELRDTMKKDDELELWRRIRRRDDLDPSFIQIAEDIGIPYKRARYIAKKWSRNGFYEWGIAWRVGWVMDDEWCYDDGAERKRELDRLAGIRDDDTPDYSEG